VPLADYTAEIWLSDKTLLYYN